MKRKTLKWLGFLAGVGLVLWLWQRDRATGGVGRRLKYATIRLSRSARLVRGRERATWVHRFYALLAPAYDLLFLKMPGYRQAARDLIERLDVGAHDTVLDVGCGTGLLTLPLAERAGRVVGLDLSPAMLEKLAAKAARQGLAIELREGSVLDLPFADGEFTVVTTAFTLLYLTPKEKQRAMAEIHRVLAPGGWYLSYTDRGCTSAMIHMRHLPQLLRPDGESGGGDCFEHVHHRREAA